MSGGTCYQFQQSGVCKFGDTCRFSHGADVSQGAFGGGWGRQPDNGFGRPAFGGGGFGGGGFGAAPSRGFGGASSGPCYSFQETGQCRFGETCRYSHGDGQQQPQQGGNSFGGSWGSSFNRRGNAGQICYTWRDTGSCKFGETCRYSHSADGAVDNSYGGGGGGGGAAPRRFGGGAGAGAGAGVCYNFQQTGSCKFGDTCRFSHSLDKKDDTQLDQGAINDGQPHMEQN